MNKGKEQKGTSLSNTEWGKLTSVDRATGYSTQRFVSCQPATTPLTGKTWKPAAESDTLDCPQFSSYYILREVESPRSQHILAEIGAGNGMEVYVNGKLIAKHLNPYRTPFRMEKSCSRSKGYEPSRAPHLQPL